jgi:hypothetical protein
LLTVDEAVPGLYYKIFTTLIKLDHLHTRGL